MRGGESRSGPNGTTRDEEWRRGEERRGKTTRQNKKVMGGDKRK